MKGNEIDEQDRVIRDLRHDLIVEVADSLPGASAKDVVAAIVRRMDDGLPQLVEVEMEVANEVTPTGLTDDDFLEFSSRLHHEMQHLDGREWQEAQDLREQCHRGRAYNDLSARIAVARAINARLGVTP